MARGFQKSRTGAFWVYTARVPWLLSLLDLGTVIAVWVVVNAGVAPFADWTALRTTFFPVWHLLATLREYSMQVERPLISSGADPTTKAVRVYWQWTSSELDHYMGLVLVGLVADLTAGLSAVLRHDEPVYWAFLGPLVAFHLVRLACAWRWHPSGDGVYDAQVPTILRWNKNLQRGMM